MSSRAGARRRRRGALAVAVTVLTPRPASSHHVLPPSQARPRRRRGRVLGQAGREEQRVGDGEHDHRRRRSRIAVHVRVRAVAAGDAVGRPRAEGGADAQGRHGGQRGVVRGPQGTPLRAPRPATRAPAHASVPGRLRRGRLQHRHGRVPRGAHGPVVPRADPRADVPAGGQLRRAQRRRGRVRPAQAFRIVRDPHQRADRGVVRQRLLALERRPVAGRLARVQGRPGHPHGRHAHAHQAPARGRLHAWQARGGRRRPARVRLRRPQRDQPRRRGTRARPPPRPRPSLAHPPRPLFAPRSPAKRASPSTKATRRGSWPTTAA